MKWQEWSAVADDPSLWKNREEKGLLKAEYVRDYVLRLWFEDEMDVSIYELDFRPLVVDDNPGGMFAPKDRERFKQVRGEYALIWPTPETRACDEQKSIDIAPECVRFFCEKYGRPLKVSARHWVEAPERYELYWIAYFDLLGFENVVREPGNMAHRLGNEASRPRIWLTLEHYQRARAEFKDVKQNYQMQARWFSDTFLFYTKDESSDSFRRIANASGAFFRRMFGALIPLRGCLAHGDLYSGSEDELEVLSNVVDEDSGSVTL